MSNINIEDQLADILAKEIAAEIDFGIMSELMGAQGWHKIKLERFLNREHSVDIRCWVEQNVKGKFLNNGSLYIFEEKGDAINFALKWA